MKNLFLKIGFAFCMMAQTQNIIAQKTYPCSSPTTANWQSLGPTTIPVNGDGIGLVSGIVLHPSQPNTLYMAAMSGGIFKSTNSGNTWSQLGDPNYFDNSSIGAIAIAPSATSIMYCATGTTSPSTGVFKSTDGGATWTKTNFDNYVSNPSSFGAKNTSFSFVSKLIVHPMFPNTIFAAVQSRITDGLTLRDANAGGLYKSVDGGTVWTQVLGSTSHHPTATTILNSDYLKDVAFLPSDPAIMFCSGERLFRSTNSGDTWYDETHLLPNIIVSPYDMDQFGIEVEACPAAPNQIVILQNAKKANGTSLPVPDGHVKTLMSYNSLTNTYSFTHQISDWAFVGAMLRVNPNDVNKIHCLGNNFPFLFSSATMQWAQMSNDVEGGGILHVDVRDLAISTNDSVYVCTDGGLYRYNPTNQTWKFINKGLALTQPNGIAVSQTDGRILLSTDHNRGMVYEPSTQTWRRHPQAQYITGDGGGALIDYNNSNRMYLMDFFNGGLISRSEDGFTASAYSDINFGNYGIQCIAMHPYNANTIYFGKKDLWKSSNYGDAPRIALSNGLNGSAGSNIQIIEISPANSNTIFISYYSNYQNNIYYTANEGATWTELSPPLPCQNFNQTVYSDNNGGLNSATTTTKAFNFCILRAIAAHPTDPNIVWISWDSYGNDNTGTSGSVWKGTLSNGVWLWVEDSQGLPKLPVRSLIIDKQSPVVGMYAGTKVGVYYKDNTLSQWQCFNDQLPNCDIWNFSIRYPTREIYAALYGRGIWKSPLACPVITQDLYIANSNTPNLNVTKVAHNSISGAKSDVNTSAPLIIASGNNMTLAAGRSVTLLPGFNSQTGAVFKAYASPSLNCDHNNVARKESSSALEINTPALSQAEEVKALPPAVQIVEIYPNPNNGVFKIKTNLKKDEVIESIVIRDVSGTMLKEYKELPPDGSFDVQELLNSHYLIMEIHTNQGKYSDRIVKETRLGEEKDKR